MQVNEASHNINEQKEKFYENAIASILKEEIPRSLQGSVLCHSSSNYQDPVSAFT